MQQLTFENLRDAVAGGAVALRSTVRLQPVDGPGGKVFPPTYATTASKSNKYVVEDRQLGDRVATTVLLDSVASQANRAELALLDGWEVGELEFPVPYVDFRGESDLDDLGRITVLEAPHRLADAIFRDSLLGGTLFRLSEIGQAITDARPDNATAMFRYAPTALLFGQWDSTGPKGGLGSKFQRAYVSEIVGFDAEIGKKVGSRLDPLQIEREAAVVYEHKDKKQVWTLDPAEAVIDKGKPKSAGKGGGRPSEINHGNIAPSIDTQAGGVTISVAHQTVVISFPALRRLRFSGASREAEIAARTAIAALGVVAIAYGYETDHDLRSRCLLIPEHAPELEMVSRDGSTPERVAVDRESSAQILGEAAAQAKQLGIGWEEDQIVLRPAPKLLDLLRRSREVSARETVGADS
ncbi:MAG: type I-U CRISPR-associated RAMP protein Csb1/Cas7u [Acidimicrobiaceae bacterium]|nr:type I-U CRISPR-associated RAMP protein Csb1/Cas7u [Acidimicrobiaceae bacterium]